MIKAILIDLGKTILTNTYYNCMDGFKEIYNYLENNNLTLDEFCQESKMVYDEIIVNERIGNEIEIPITSFFESLSLKLSKKFKISYEELERIYLFSSTKEYLIKDVELFLEYCLKNDIFLYGVSNSCFSSPYLLKQLDDLNVSKYLNGLISSADLLVRKPNKYIFNKAYEVINSINHFNKEDVGYLGNDYKIDMIGANKAGLKPLWINHNNEEDSDNICLINANNYKIMIEEVKKINQKS